MPKPDFLIHDEGSIVTFTPLNEMARSYLRDNMATESWQWMGDSLCVDHHYAQGLLHVLQHEEFFVCERE